MGYKTLILLTLFTLTSCIPRKPPQPVIYSDFILGTVCTITIYDRADNSAAEKAFSRIREIEELMSVNIPTSDIYKVNAFAGIWPIEVHDDVIKVVERAIYYAKLTGGAFDPTVGPLVSLWNKAGANERVPSQEEINQVLPLINWRNIEFNAYDPIEPNPQRQTIFLKKHGMALDLGAIAKGFAADEAAIVLKNEGIKRAIINLGGDIVLIGKKPNGTPWRVGVQIPFAEKGVYAGIIEANVSNKENSIVTSGIYERFFEVEEKKYHHIFSPSSGHPVENSLSSVTIIADNCMEADAISTSVFVLGYEKGMDFISAFPGVEAIFIFQDNTVIKTKGAPFSLIDIAFQMAANQ